MCKTEVKMYQWIMDECLIVKKIHSRHIICIYQPSEDLGNEEKFKSIRYNEYTAFDVTP